MKRFTKRDENGKPILTLDQDGLTMDDMIKKLAMYEDAEEKGRMLIAPREVDDWLYAIIYDENFHTYDISEHRIVDFCLSGTIITDAPVGDSGCEIWTLEDQKEYHVCFSEDEAEEKLEEMKEEEQSDH